ncbi:MAG: hypothetical protein IPK57_02750 [Chitinophagaceae bacterium]|nr:hypothetical protein [Chitinophagaceae bacterium]
MKGYHFILAVFSCLYWLVSGYWAAAQSYYEKDFVHYTTRHGLSDNNVNVIQQDENGYIWIGTEVGLNCFDGNRFIKYHPGNKSLPLRAERIRKLKRFSFHRNSPSLAMEAYLYWRTPLIFHPKLSAS